MALFKYIETIFFVSLAITFILILMLVYHFKDRIAHLEKKIDTMFEIMNNVVKEMMVIKTAQSTGFPSSYSSNTHNVYIPPASTFAPTIPLPSSLRVEKVIVSDDEEEEDDDDYEDDDYEEEDDNDEEEEEEAIEEEVEKENKEETKEDDIVLEDIQDEIIPVSLTEEKEEPKADLVETVDVSYESLDVPESSENRVIQTVESAEAKQYKKLDIPTLRTLISTKGASVDTSKMKKKDLIQLLSTL
jgi:hypothetical protein